MEHPDKTILLVEDDRSIRELYAIAFMNEGISILMAENGADGLQIALEQHPSIVLLDIDMPVMSGYQVCDQLRKDAWGKNVPIIFLTNRSDPRDIAFATTEQPDDYIVKVNVPVKEVVNRVLRRMGIAPRRPSFKI